MKTYFEASTVISSNEDNEFERNETCIRIVPIKFTYITTRAGSVIKFPHYGSQY